MMMNRWMYLSVATASFALFGFEGGCGGEPGEPLPPRPAVCEELGQPACEARTDCEPIYEWSACACAACAPGAECPPCDCFVAPEPAFLGCRDRDPCEGLDETACVADPQCAADYGWLPCPRCDAKDPSVCAICDAVEGYLGCHQLGPCEGLDENACVATSGCEPQYAEVACAAICQPDGEGGCLPCNPALFYGGCFPTDCGGDHPPPSPPPEPECPDVVCALFCEDGFARDPNGCFVCDCL